MSIKPYIQRKLENSLGGLTNFYNIHHRKSDNNMQMEMGIPLNTDIFIVCLINKPEIKIYNLYILREDSKYSIDHKIEELVEKIKKDIL
ncbi:hypothetical protein SMI01S_16080 [Sphingobacterium mizutaii NBRC 14946 = DSM 11724]|uniref:Uncharacterized protein n=2 Tax=Sphingobacterium mizutaii TaxID=1010 RepID=A0AAJ4X8E2_9SPHI|nr:hypothetical protein SMI01S_16080 [Sphingobacterium mizutaii NBRC 14946 = DSM 11724]SDL78755.1 hypothetical protein SAMN05192578_10982 [Sphingobacterium mizutaii]SNV37600.1 Uncharacterised protein [Sphingobacterium mizutaii]